MSKSVIILPVKIQDCIFSADNNLLSTGIDDYIVKYTVLKSKIYGPWKYTVPVKYTVLRENIRSWPENIRSWRKIYGPLLKIYGLLLKIYGQVRKIYGPDRKIYGPFQIVMSHISDVYFPVFEWAISRTVYFSGPYIFRQRTVYFQRKDRIFSKFEDRIF